MAIQFEKNKKLYREPIIAFVFTDNKTNPVACGRPLARPSRFISAIVVSMDWQGMIESDDAVGLDDKIITAVPAQPGWFRILGEMDNGDLEELGYEYLGYTRSEAEWEKDRQDKAQHFAEVEKLKALGPLGRGANKKEHLPSK
jgi:hypothetical protein